MSSIHAQIARELDAGTPVSEIQTTRRHVTILLPQEGESREHCRKRLFKGVRGCRKVHHQERHHRRLRKAAAAKQQEIWDAKNPRTLASAENVMAAEAALKKLADPKEIRKRGERREKALRA